MDNYLVFTIITVLLIVPMISYAVGRMYSLAVDMVNAAASIIVFFVDTSARYIDQKGHATSQMVLILALILLISVVFSVFCIGIHLTIHKEREVLKISEEEFGTRYIEIGYCISVFAAILFLLYSFIVAVSVPILFSSATQHTSTLFSVACEIGVSISGASYVSVSVLAIYVLLLTMRYWQHIDGKLRLWGNH